MKLMEEKYRPTSLDQILSPNREDLMSRLQCLIEKQKNILFIGSAHTFKSVVMNLIIRDKPKESVLVIDTFTDLSFYNNPQNELRNFCKSSTKHKCVVIEHFDILHENNQQYLKEIMDECPKIWFLFGCENTSKIHEIIQTRVSPILFEPFTSVEYGQLLDRMSEGEQIRIHNPEVLLAYPNLTLYYLYNLFNKFVLLGLTDIPDVSPYITLLDTRILTQFFETMEREQIVEATQILFGLYETGYSLLDIYYFMYEYLKTSARRDVRYLYIEKICFYIQYIYDGFDHKLVLLFLTNELFSIYKSK